MAMTTSVIGQDGDAGRIFASENPRFDHAQRDDAKVHPLHFDHHRLHGFSVIQPGAHRQDVIQAQVVEGVAEGLGAVLPAGLPGTVHDVVGCHAHDIKSGVTQCHCRARVAGEHVGEDTAGVQRGVAEGGIEGADGEVRRLNQVAHLSIDVFRIPARIDRRLHAARRHDHAGEEQGDARRSRECGRFSWKGSGSRRFGWKGG
jgi:hypothetical protein